MNAVKQKLPKPIEDGALTVIWTEPMGLSYKRAARAQVAQLVEQRTENPCVGGSIPPLGTTDPGALAHRRARMVIKTRAAHAVHRAAFPRCPSIGKGVTWAVT